MDEHNIEQAVEEDLEKMSMNCSDMGSDSEDEEYFTASNEKQENDLPDSVLSYFKGSSNRLKSFEQLILEDIEDFETMCSEMSTAGQHADMNILDSNSAEDPLKLKERIMSEIEEEVADPCETHDSNGVYDTDDDTYKDSERQFMFEWRRLEERLQKEEEQRQAELDTGKEQKMKCTSLQFREELRRTEATNQFEYLEPVEDSELNQSLSHEMVKQKELIKRLEEQIEEERRVYEEVKQEEQKRLKARCIGAATTLQAAFRGTLVRRWSRNELNKKREEEQKRQENMKELEKRREREERMKMEREKERRRMDEEVQRHRDEAERRRAEYEKAKQRERHRLENERKLQETKDRTRQKDEEKQKRMEERKEEEETRKVQEEKIQEEEKAKMIDNEMKRQRGIKSQEGIKEKRKVQEDKVKRHKEEDKAQRNEAELKRKDEEESPERIKQKRVEGEISHGKVEEDEEKTREEEEKKIKDETTQKGMEYLMVCEEIQRKGREEAKKKGKEEEEQKKMKIRNMEEEKRNVQGEGGKEIKDVEAAKRTEDEQKRQEEETQKHTDVRRIKEEKGINEETEEKSTDADIKIIEEQERQNRMNEKGVVGNIPLIHIKQIKDNETQMQEEQIKRLKQEDMETEDIVMKRKADRENMTEGTSNAGKNTVKGLVGQRDNSESDKENETTKLRKDEKFVDSASQLCLSQSHSMSKSVLARTLSSRMAQEEQHNCFPELTVCTLSADTSNRRLTPSPERSLTSTGELQCPLEDMNSGESLSDSTEHKRLTWIMNCTPWSKLSMQNKKKRLSTPARRKGRRAALGQSLLPLPVDAVLKSGSWSSLKQVTSVTLEDLSGCSLSTLSECTRLQSVMLRRCRLQALDGLNQCAELQYIDLQDNHITYVDCGGLTKLEVLLLGRNQLTCIHGLDDAVNLTVLQLSHNAISRISGLGSLKRLHRLTVDHNHLISTSGLCEAFTLLHLDCSNNHLSRVEGLENCALLNTLHLRGNNLTEMPVLKNHVLLRELYLDDNSICSLHGLDSCWLPLLRCLSVPQNSIIQLPLLLDLVSLRTFDASHNCLSDLRNICMSLQGCTHLQVLSLDENPVQHENNWRSSVLAVNPNLIALNGEQTGASGKLFADSTQLWSFQALCQTHQDQIDSILQRHCIEISSAPSARHAQLLVGKHASELFQLAEEQRYAHEYGDSSVCQTAIQDTLATIHMQELSDWDLRQEKNGQEKSQHPAEHKTLQMWQTPHLSNLTNKYQSPSGDHHAGCAGSSTQNIRDTQPSEDRHSRYGVQASRMDLRTVAVMVIQRRWRAHRQKRSTRHLGQPAKAPARLSPKREVKSCTTRPKCLNKDNAATVIQAVWRGYILRKRLTRALMLAKLSDGDEAYEEVDMDEFFFDEEAMEKDWIPVGPDMLPSSLLTHSEQLLRPKPLLSLQELHKNACVQLWKPRQAWINNKEAPVPEQSQSSNTSSRMQSPESTVGKKSFLEKSEELLEEWGISNSSTAYLMLKRAQRMKVRNQHHQRKLPAGRGDVSAQEALRGEPEHTDMQTSQRTYQWLQSQAVSSRRSSAPSTSDHFLPEIDPEILNGGRVQLVASIGYRETPDSAVRIADTGFSSPNNHQAYTRAHSAGYAKRDVPSPQKVTLAPSRKERISFRDNPVQLSGGWGGGKKRSKSNKFK